MIAYTLGDMHPDTGRAGGGWGGVRSKGFGVGVGVGGWRGRVG